MIIGGHYVTAISLLILAKSFLLKVYELAMNLY